MAFHRFGCSNSDNKNSSNNNKNSSNNKATTYNAAHGHDTRVSNAYQLDIMRI
jgi:hypothetical protein